MNKVLLRIDGKIAAKTLYCVDGKVLACVNCSCFEDVPNIKSEFDCYGLLEDVVKTGLIEGLSVKKNILCWFEKEQKRIEKEKKQLL